MSKQSKKTAKPAVKRVAPPTDKKPKPTKTAGVVSVDANNVVVVNPAPDLVEELEETKPAAKLVAKDGMVMMEPLDEETDETLPKE
jgi:hypothetical protein